MTSVVYRGPRTYRAVLRLLYGAALDERERIVAALVPGDATVVDVCCGDGGIRRRLSCSSYEGVDVSPTMVGALSRSGVRARVADVAREDPPGGDVVLLLGSLYQFLPDADAVVDRLRRAARRFVVVAEPYTNLSTHPFRPLAALARRMTDPGVDSSTSRFDETSLRALFARHDARHVEKTARELVAVLPPRAP